MGYFLIDETKDSVSVNFWNWGALHEVVRAAGVFPDEVWGPLRGSFGPPLSAEHVARLRDFLKTQVLPRTTPGARVLLTGEVTNEPDDGKMHYEESEQWKNYSLTHEVLCEVIKFLDRAEGPVRVQ